VAELTSGREFILSQLYKAGAGLVIDRCYKNFMDNRVGFRKIQGDRVTPYNPNVA